MQPLIGGLLAAGKGSKAAVVARQRVVGCHAIAAAERPTKTTGPIIMNGQILHSLSEERLELVKTLGPYMETQVGRAASSTESSASDDGTY